MYGIIAGVVIGLWVYMGVWDVYNAVVVAPGVVIVGLLATFLPTSTSLGVHAGWVGYKSVRFYSRKDRLSMIGKTKC